MAFYPAVDAGPPPSVTPVTYISASYAPTLIFHGTADTTASLTSSQRLFQRVLDGKVPAELHTFEGAEHIFRSRLGPGVGLRFAGGSVHHPPAHEASLAVSGFGRTRRRMRVEFDRYRM